jgi:hypothetical protein
MFVSIHDYDNGRVVIVEYDGDTVEDVEEEIVKPNSGGKEYEWMCMDRLNVVINPDLQ